MKKIRKLSGYKKKKITQTDETLDNIEKSVTTFTLLLKT